MDHVIARVGADHCRAVAGLAAELAAELGIDEALRLDAPAHITLVSFTGLAPAAALAALAPVAATAAPFSVRAHGYGVFTGDTPRDLSLHVMVVRSAPLDELHGRIHGALAAAGASVDGVTRPEVWTPHITILDRHLTPARLGRAVELLAARPHRSWTVGVDAVALARRGDGGTGGVLDLTGAQGSRRSSTTERSVTTRSPLTSP